MQLNLFLLEGNCILNMQKQTSITLLKRHLCVGICRWLIDYSNQLVSSTTMQWKLLQTDDILFILTANFYALKIGFVANIAWVSVTQRWWHLCFSFQMASVLISKEISVGVREKWVHSKEWLAHEIVRINVRVLFWRQRVFSISSWGLIPTAMAASGFDAFFNFYFKRVEEGTKISRMKWATKGEMDMKEKKGGGQKMKRQQRESNIGEWIQEISGATITNCWKYLKDK